MQPTPSYHPTLRELAELFLEPMQSVLPSERAEGLALDLVEAIRHRFGGLLIYIPTHHRLKRQQRNAAIVREFDGSNHKELARRYGITQRTVYGILKKDRGKIGKDQEQAEIN